MKRKRTYRYDLDKLRKALDDRMNEPGVRDLYKKIMEEFSKT